MNDPTFQTQQFLENGPARREAEYKMQQGQMAIQGSQMLQQTWQRGQQFQMEMAKAQSDLANDEVQRQSAYENLRYAQMLHNTDMLAAQKEAVLAESSLRVAQ